MGLSGKERANDKGLHWRRGNLQHHTQEDHSPPSDSYNTHVHFMSHDPWAMAVTPLFSSIATHLEFKTMENKGAWKSPRLLGRRTEFRVTSIRHSYQKGNSFKKGTQNSLMGAFLATDVLPF